jgi:CBS domain-containing protein
VFTDGDLRRIFEADKFNSQTSINKVMTKNPKAICKDDMAVIALEKMEEFEITSLPVVDENNPKPVRKSNPDVVAVYDLEAQGWRSFRWDSIVSFSNGA